VTYLTDGVAGSPAERMPSGVAIKPITWLMKIG